MESHAKNEASDAQKPQQIQQSLEQQESQNVLGARQLQNDQDFVDNDDEQTKELNCKDELKRSKSVDDQWKRRAHLSQKPKVQTQLSLDAHMRQKMKDARRQKLKHQLSDAQKRPLGWHEGKSPKSLLAKFGQSQGPSRRQPFFDTEQNDESTAARGAQATGDDEDQWEPFSTDCEWKAFPAEELWEPLEVKKLLEPFLLSEERWEPFLHHDGDDNDDDDEEHWNPFPVDEDWEPFLLKGTLEQAAEQPQQSPDEESVHSDYDEEQSYSVQTGEQEQQLPKEQEVPLLGNELQQIPSAETQSFTTEGKMQDLGHLVQAEGQKEFLPHQEKTLPNPCLTKEKEQEVAREEKQQASPIDQTESERSNKPGKLTDTDVVSKTAVTDSDLSQKSDALSDQNEKTDLSKFLEDAEEELSCLVCFELLQDPHTPKNLDCGHVCCAICLHDLLQMDPAIQCPACRCVTSVPDLQLTSLKTNLRLRNLAEIYHKHSKKESKSGQDTGQCAEHGDRIRYYCVTCTQVVCGTCVCDSHNKSEHNVRELRDVYVDQTREMNDVLEMTTKKFQDNANRLSNLKAAVQGFLNLLALEEETIDKETQQMIAKIHKAADAKKAVIRKGRQSQLEAMDKQKRKLEIHQEEIQKAMVSAKDAIEKNKEWDYVMRHKELLATITALLEQVQLKTFGQC